MSDLLRMVLTAHDEDPPEGTLSAEPYARLDDGRNMWLVPAEPYAYAYLQGGVSGAFYVCGKDEADVALFEVGGDDE